MFFNFGQGRVSHLHLAIMRIRIFMYLGGVWYSGLVRWCSDQGSTCRFKPHCSQHVVVSLGKTLHPKIAPVGIVHRIEYVSRFG